MPSAEFSEFSYGYAVVRETEELMKTLGKAVTDAPKLPSLIEENTVGYDANLVSVDFGLFLQFKRSFFVSKLHGGDECAPPPGGGVHCTWGHWEEPHYRFEADLDSQQFTVMHKYESEIAVGYRVGASFYVAPTFHKQSDFTAAYIAGDILKRSIVVPPSKFYPVHPGVHQYSINVGGTAGVITSEPTLVDPQFAHGEMQRRVSSALANESPSSLTLAALGSWVAASLAESGVEGPFDVASTRGALAAVEVFARLHAGAMLLLGRSTQNPDLSVEEDR